MSRDVSGTDSPLYHTSEARVLGNVQLATGVVLFAVRLYYE